MGKLIVTEFLTLDGVAQAPGGPDEDPESGFSFGGWQAPMVDAESMDVVFEQAKDMDALLLGRKTYDIFSGYWPSAPADMPFTKLLNGVAKYVASRTLQDPLNWQGSVLLGDDIVAKIAALKTHHDEIHVIGSLDLVQTLLTEDLIDRLSVWIYPIVLGGGKKLFADGAVPAALKLTESTTYPVGVINAVYEFAGLPTLGDMSEV